MEKKLKEIVSKELEQFHCSILLDEVKEKVRKLRSYGVGDDEIVAAINEEDIFPQLVVAQNYEIYLLSGEKKTKVEMEPLVKAVYLLFLLHPEGIVLKYLPDFRKELMSLYLLLRPTGLTNRVEKSIIDVTSATSNSINEKCAKIRKIFSVLLPKSMAKYYTISGKRGEPKKIDLIRANVIWECKLSCLEIL